MQSIHLKTVRIEKVAPNPDGAMGCEVYTLLGDGINFAEESSITLENAELLPARRVRTGNAFRLKILHFNDLHGHLVQNSPAGFQPVFSRMVWKIRDLRQCCDQDPDSAVLVLSAGDDLIGSAFDELMGEDEGSYVVHAGYHLYSKAGVDAGVLGNHDLDMGPKMLAHAIRTDARFPLLSANIVDPGGLSGICFPAAILAVKGVRVGVIGLTTSAEVVRRKGAEFQISDPVLAARNILPVLRPHCDILVLLTHLGRSLTSPGAVLAGAGDEELARSLPYGGVHLIVGGHTHEALNERGLSQANIVNGIPIVQAGQMGRFLGEVNLTIHPPAAVTYTRLWQTADLPVDEDFEREKIKPLIEEVRPLFDRPLGKAAQEPDLSTEAVRNAVAAGESAMANFVTDAIVSRCHALGYEVDFAMIDASILRSGLEPGGVVRYRDWFNIMPFADTIRFCRMTGRELQALLEDNARRIDHPAEPNTERGFVHFSREVRYTIRRGRDRLHNRLVEARLNGRPVCDGVDRLYTAAVPNFFRELSAAWERSVREAGEYTPVEVKGWACQDTDLFLRGQMVAYIQAAGGVTGEAGARRDGRLAVLEEE